MAVPIAVHRVHSMLVNRRLFESAGLKVPTTLAELSSTAEVLTDRGYTALCAGNAWHWNLSTILFDSILLASAGADYHRRFFTGEAQPSDAGDPAPLIDYLTAHYDSLR